MWTSSPNHDRPAHTFLFLCLQLTVDGFAIDKMAAEVKVRTLYLSYSDFFFFFLLLNIFFTVIVNREQNIAQSLVMKQTFFFFNLPLRKFPSEASLFSKTLSPLEGSITSDKCSVSRPEQV